MKVLAASINPIDTYIRSGHGPDAAAEARDHRHRPRGRGRCRSGRASRGSRPATASGARTRGLLGRQGTCAEFICVDEKWLYPTPAGVADEQAAACALVGITAHLGLFQRAKLQGRRDSLRQRRHRRRRVDGRADGEGGRREGHHDRRQSTRRPSWRANSGRTASSITRRTTCAAQVKEATGAEGHQRLVRDATADRSRPHRRTDGPARADHRDGRPAGAPGRSRTARSTSRGCRCSASRCST